MTEPRLTPREEIALRLRAANKTWREIGESFDPPTSPERARQIHAKASRITRALAAAPKTLRGRRMSVRALNALEKLGLLDRSPAALADVADEALLIKGVGRKTLREIRLLQEDRP